MTTSNPLSVYYSVRPTENRYNNYTIEYCYNYGELVAIDFRGLVTDGNRFDRVPAAGMRVVPVIITRAVEQRRDGRCVSTAVLRNAYEPPPVGPRPLISRQKSRLIHGVRSAVNLRRFTHVARCYYYYYY